MKIITGFNKYKLLKKIKIVSFKSRYVSSKYHVSKYYRYIYKTTDFRREANYNDILLVIVYSHKDVPILKIIK